MLSMLMNHRRADANSGYGPLSDFWYGSASNPVSAGVPVTQETALTYSAVWACTRFLSATPGRLPLNLYRKNADNRGKAIAVEDVRNRLVSKQPNPHMTPMLFKSQGFIQQVNAGNTYAEIQRDAHEKPIAFWPIHHSRVNPVIDKTTNDLYYRIKMNGGEIIDLPSRDVLHFPSMMSEDGIVGKGVITNARETIGTGLAAVRAASSTFGSGGIPRVVVESPKKWSDESRRNFRKEWKEIYGGPNGDRVGVMDEGSKLHTLDLNYRDLQFLELQQHTVEEVCRWYGVPPHKVQHLLRATFNNIEHMGMEALNDALLPWMVIWEEELDRKLLTEEEQQEMFFAFDVSEYLRGDTVTRGQYHQSLVNSGIESRNEARMAEDMNPVEGGDTFLVQGAMVALDEDGRPFAPATQQAPAELADDTPADDAEDLADPADKNEPSAPDDDSEGDTPEETDAQAIYAELAESVKIMLQETVGRMVHKETTAARRAANKPDKFLAWMDEFYGKHQEQLAEAIQYGERLSKRLSKEFSSVAIASEMCEASKASLLDLTGRHSMSTLSDAVDELCKEWDTTKAVQCVESLF